MFRRTPPPAPVTSFEDSTPTVRWGPLDLDESESTNHFMALGTTGSGKTTILRLLMQSVLPGVGKGDCRALLYDAKQDILPIASSIVAPERVVTLNPFDERGVAWDLAKDLNEPRLIHQFVTTLLPAANESQPFFIEGAQHLTYALMLSYWLSGDDYTFGDVLRGLRSLRGLDQIISRHGATRYAARMYLREKRTAYNILATIQSKILPFEPIAASWEHAKDRVAIRDWVKGEYVLVLGNSEESRAAVDAINRCIFRRATAVSLAQSESQTRRSWFFLDELADAGKLDGLISLAKKGRSKGVCLCIAFQSISGLRDPHLYSQYGADELLGQFGNRAIGRLECPETAKWVSDVIGEQEVTKVSTSSTTGGQNSTFTRSYASQVQKTVLPSQLLDIPPCSLEDGLTAYYLIRSVGTFTANIPGANLFQRELIPPNPDVPDFVPRDPMTQILRPWTKKEAAKFGAYPLKPRKPKRVKRKAKAKPTKKPRRTSFESSADPLKDLFE